MDFEACIPCYLESFNAAANDLDYPDLNNADRDYKHQPVSRLTISVDHEHEPSHAAADQTRAAGYAKHTKLA